MNSADKHVSYEKLNCCKSFYMCTASAECPDGSFLLAVSRDLWECPNYAVIDGVSILWYSQLENDL